MLHVRRPHQLEQAHQEYCRSPRRVSPWPRSAPAPKGPKSFELRAHWPKQGTVPHQSATGGPGSAGLPCAQGREQRASRFKGFGLCHCIPGRDCSVHWHPLLPESLRLLPTSLLDTPGAQGHGPHTGMLGGPHDRHSTIPTGSAAGLSVNLAILGSSYTWNHSISPVVSGLLH